MNPQHATPKHLVEAVSAGRLGAHLHLQSALETWGCDSEQGEELLDLLATEGSDNPHAFAVLLETIQEFRLAEPAIRRVLAGHAQIEEASQNTLTKVAIHLNNFDGRSRFKTWLFRVASNEAKQVVRSEARLPIAVEFVPDENFAKRFSSVISNKELFDRVFALLDDDLKELLALREFEGLTYQEMADHTGLPIGTVRSRLKRAREKLSTDLKSGLEL